MLIIAGILLPSASVPLSSAYGVQDNIILMLVRVVWIGEVILRESVFEVVPDRDEQLFKEFSEYRMEHRELESLPEHQAMERFYEDQYRDKMPHILFNLKLGKKKVVTIQRKIAVPNLYIFACGVMMIIAGAGIRILARRKQT